MLAYIHLYTQGTLDSRLATSFLQQLCQAFLLCRW